MLQRLFLVPLLLTVAACANSSPYDAGKSATDVPTHVEVIDLQQVYIATGGTDANGNPNRDPSPSQNDQEVLAVAKANIISQLTNFGYKTVEGDGALADIRMQFFVGYIPERWPLISRMVSVEGRIYDPSGTPLYRMAAAKNNPAGLIGAVVGPSRDEMVGATARDSVV